jgi:hypothetical protein
MIGFAAPLILWPIEFYLPYPYVIEELVKYFCLTWLVKSEYRNQPIKFKQRLSFSLLFASLFTLTESVMYLMNIALLNDFRLFPIRIFYTGLLHIVTTFIISLGLQKKWYIKVGTLLISMYLHYLYNSQISNFL